MLAAGGPLAGRPPSPDLARMSRVDEVENHHDVAGVTLDRRRDVSVAAVEGEAMAAAAGGLPFRDELWRRRIRNVVDTHAAAKFGIVATLAFVIHEHHAVGDAHLVRMPSLGDFEMSEDARLARIRDVDDRSAVGMVHVCDIGRGAVEPYLATTGAIEMPDEFRIQRFGHGCVLPRGDVDVRSRIAPNCPDRK